MKLTQVQLAKLAKVSQATVSDYENDITTKHRADEIMRIAAALQTTPEYILTGTGAADLAQSEADISALIETFNKLNQHSRAALIAAAKAMQLTQE